jgi:putative methyltransferase (TIGR04325 family)
MKIIKEYLPPVFIKKFTRLFYGWSGDYASWDEAKKKTSGYSNGIILEQVKNSLLKVKNGEAVYERDSVIFNKISYSFPLLAALNIIALNNKGRLNVLDFGGSLGSSYYQNRNFFSDLAQFNWCVVEQHHFVEEGLNSFADKQLHFYYDIASCLQVQKIEVLLLSSVLQYLENPYSFLEAMLVHNFEYVIVDRTPLLAKGKDRITVQSVPKEIYKAKYPCWILNQGKVVNMIREKYDLIFEDELQEKIYLDNASFRFFFFKRKNN